MSAEELAGRVCQTLKDAGVIVTLTGGGCVAVWSRGKYVSKDLDFIEEGPVPRRKIRAVMKRLGFREVWTPLYPPLNQILCRISDGTTDGRRPAHRTRDRTENTRMVFLSSFHRPTVSRTGSQPFFTGMTGNRLSRRCCVAQTQQVDLEDIRRWSKSEENQAKFRIFKRQAGRPLGRRKIERSNLPDDFESFVEFFGHFLLREREQDHKPSAHSMAMCVVIMSRQFYDSSSLCDGRLFRIG